MNENEGWKKIWKESWKKLSFGMKALLILSSVAVVVALFYNLPYAYKNLTSAINESLAHPETIFLQVSVVLFILVAGASIARSDSRERSRIEKSIEKAERQIEENPEQTRPLWDLARNRLELYFERNQIQVRSIFWITLLVMIVGFAMITYGIYKAVDQKAETVSLIASASGIITEFIGATFLVIYKSTLAQASDYVKTLARINAVGMSVQVIDSIPEGQLKNQARAAISKQILDFYSKEP